MKCDWLVLTKELLATRGVNARVLTAADEQVESFDEGLRHQVYQNFDYRSALQRVADQYKDNTIYFITDSFELSYILLKCPDETAANPEPRFFIIGPYLKQTASEFIEHVMQRRNAPLSFITEMKNYYLGIPCLTDYNAMQNEVLKLAKYIFDTETFSIGEDLNAFFNDEEYSFKAEPANVLSMSMVEERYRCEDDLLNAVEQGNAKLAMMQLSAFQKFKMEERQADEVRQLKNFLFVLNTLFRKAVQRADVHPMYIDKVSSTFARAIETAQTMQQLGELSDDMIHKYCLTVRNHSCKAYSKKIQRALNYIDFHYKEPIKLSEVSDFVQLNPSYLSSIFKKETGSSIVNYINQKRIHRALALLATSDLPINKIAELVGFLDENYFSRIFLSLIQKSPRDYRKSIHAAEGSGN